MALAWLVAVSCGDSPVDPPPDVAEVTVTPGAAFLDLADTLRLTAGTVGPGGGSIDDPGLTWRSTATLATVDPTGLVTGLAPGEVRIEAVAGNGVVGSALVRVTPVTAIEPAAGRYGQLVTIRGVGLPVATMAHFTDADGGRVRAFTRQSGAEALEVWVPVGAASGPLRLDWPGDSIVTSRHFDLIAAEDIYARQAEPVEVPFPFHNPSLEAGSGAQHGFRFQVPAATPFSLHLVDRGSPFVSTTVRAWLFRVSPGPTTLVSFAMTQDNLPAGGAVLDSVAYSRASLPPGEYVVLVSALDLRDAANPDARRAFGLRLSAAESYDLAPDAYEPNDFPAEAPVVALPFQAPGVRAENPFAMDHYAFDVAGASTVTLSTTAADRWLLLYLLQDDDEDILAAWENDRVVAGAGGDQAAQQVQATVPAGRYTALVWDWAGHARPYDLSITVTPAADGAAAVAGAAAGDVAGGAIREAAMTRRPRR